MHIKYGLFCSSATPCSVLDLSEVFSIKGRKVRRLMRNSGTPTTKNILLSLQFVLVYFTAFSHAGDKVQGDCKTTCFLLQNPPANRPIFFPNKVCNLAYSGIYAMYEGTECIAY